MGERVGVQVLAQRGGQLQFTSCAELIRSERSAGEEEVNQVEVNAGCARQGPNASEMGTNKLELELSDYYPVPVQLCGSARTGRGEG